MSYFLNFSWKSPAVIPIFVPKNVNSVKTKLYFGLKKQYDALFFRIFHEKIKALMPIFCQQNVHFLKKTLLRCRYFVKMTFNLLKTRCSHVIFWNFLEKPHPAMAICGQKNVNFVKTTLYYGPKKSKGCPFFPIFHDKISTLMPIFSQKNVRSKKNTLLLCP